VPNSRISSLTARAKSYHVERIRGGKFELSAELGDLPQNRLFNESNAQVRAGEDQWIDAHPNPVGRVGNVVIEVGDTSTYMHRSHPGRPRKLESLHIATTKALPGSRPWRHNIQYPEIRRPP